MTSIDKSKINKQDSDPGIIDIEKKPGIIDKRKKINFQDLVKNIRNDISDMKININKTDITEISDKIKQLNELQTILKNTIVIWKKKNDKWININTNEISNDKPKSILN